MRITQVFTGEEFRAMGDDAVARGLYRNDRRVFLPGMAWFEPWHFDPTGNWQRAGKHVMYTERPGPEKSFLSPHYWRDWADKRPPICVVCPNGELWEIDRTSSNGDGWVVTGDLPDITCSPSIVVPGYHGFLRGGEFTADIEGRGPNGIVRSVP
ncbi:hypothetical protein [Beijerinckia sp. L45]|uniref:hypothetical protein n=1 Tax=Beijerinckia sp. L45 TaxID=1641855 RepID=UPI00131DF49A|nr:hypothetical protein [Beijerinckia sp. L45]